MKETKYFVNPEKKTVVCIITVQDDYFREIHCFEGKAKCSPEDTFDEETGRKIAQKRAYIKMKTHFRDGKVNLRKLVNLRMEELIRLNTRLTEGIMRNESEINMAKADIRNMGNPQ